MFYAQNFSDYPIHDYLDVSSYFKVTKETGVLNILEIHLRIFYIEFFNMSELFPISFANFSMELDEIRKTPSGKML